MRIKVKCFEGFYLLDHFSFVFCTGCCFIWQTVCFRNNGTRYRDETQYLANSLCDWIWLNIPPCRGAGESWVLTSWHVITRHDTWCGARADQGTCHHSKGSNMCNVRGLSVMSNLYISNPQPQSEPRLCSLCGQREAAGFYWFPQL